MIWGILISFLSGAFTGIFAISLLITSKEADLTAEILREKRVNSDLIEKNEVLKKRIKNLSTENAKLFAENMRLRRGKCEVEN